MVKKIAIIDNPYVRDAQVFHGDPRNDDDIWENDENWFDSEMPVFVGIFEGTNIEEVRAAAAESANVHPESITLLGLDGKY